MSWKKILALKDKFSYRQKVGLLLVAGVVCGLGGLFMYLLRAHTYFIGDNPSACVNCHIMTPYYATWLFTRTNRQAVQWRHVQRLSCAPPELGIEVWFQGDGRTEAHSLFRDALRTTGSDGRDADGSGGNGQLHTLSRTAEHGVCEDGAHGLHEAAGPRRQGVLGLSS